MMWGGHAAHFCAASAVPSNGGAARWPSKRASSEVWLELTDLGCCCAACYWQRIAIGAGGWWPGEAWRTCCGGWWLWAMAVGSVVGVGSACGKKKMHV
mmetsp:Transcript_30065/g.96994  ORF Transcript_30065/g.96994 Transcript_30065/m.96994 type:complete len:98 (+) Transcript_30065:1330-1623(+)